MSRHHLTLEEQTALAVKLRDALFWRDSNSPAGMIPICVDNENAIIEVILTLDDTISLEDP